MKPITEMSTNKSLASQIKPKKTNCTIGRPPLGPQTLPISHPPQPQSLHDRMKGLEAVERKCCTLLGNDERIFFDWKCLKLAIVFFLCFQTMCTSLRVKEWGKEDKEGETNANL